MQSLLQQYEISPSLLKPLLSMDKSELIEELRFTWLFPAATRDVLLYECYLEFLADVICFARKNRFNVVETLAVIQLTARYMGSSPERAATRDDITRQLLADGHFRLLSPAHGLQTVLFVESTIEPVRALSFHYATLPQLEDTQTVTLTVQYPTRAAPLAGACSPKEFIERIDKAKADAEQAQLDADEEARVAEEARLAQEEADRAAAEEAARVAAEEEAARLESERIAAEQAAAEAKAAEEEEERLKAEEAARQEAEDRALPPDVAAEVARQAAAFRRKLEGSVDSVVGEIVRKTRDGQG